MGNRNFIIDDIVKHLKEKKHHIIAFAQHSKTGGKLVIYQ
mgnify:CR=1 FL=1